MTEASMRREYVAEFYDSPRWRTRVAMMPDYQITAIYLRFMRDGKKPQSEAPPKAPIKAEKPDDPQIRLF